MTATLRRLRWQARFGNRQIRAERSALARRAVEDSKWPWYAAGGLVQHYAVDALTLGTLCLRTTSRVSSSPVRTLLGFTCWSCRRLRDRAIKQLRATGEVIHRPLTSSRVRDRHGDPARVCAGCARVGLCSHEAYPAWPCPHAHLTPEDQRQHQTVLDTVASAVDENYPISPRTTGRVRDALTSNPDLDPTHRTFRRAEHLLDRIEADGSSLDPREFLRRIDSYALDTLTGLAAQVRPRFPDRLLLAPARQALLDGITADPLLAGDPVMVEVEHLLVLAADLEAEGELAAVPLWDDLDRVLHPGPVAASAGHTVVEARK